MTKRGHGEGGIDERGENVFRLRYRVAGKRHTKTFRGTLTEARKELRKLVRAGDAGQHVEPDKITVGEWILSWLDAGAPGRKKAKVGERTLERYSELLRTHVIPKLSARPLQQLRSGEIDQLYLDMEKQQDGPSPRTQHHVHIVLGACMATAFRTKLIVANPMDSLKQIPSVRELDEDDDADLIGEGLSEADLAKLIAGFSASSLYPVIALAAATGARRNELLALRWVDLDVEKKTLRIEWTLEQTKKHGVRRKRPKTARGRRTVDLDDTTLALLLAEKNRHLRIVAGVPDGADIIPALVRLPEGALMFPAVPSPGSDYSFTAWRNPRNFSKEFARRAGVIGFGSTRFHDLRGIHATALLDAGIPVHTVAQRIGDDPAVLLRNYTKRRRTKQANDALAAAISALASGFLGS
ncbi:integrase [Bradyrhizobium sp. AZCC 2262]|uniref:tyrosine-type recombinase/integrase n=1 Tax=Bradyrhizobium sp. AZCC 2262 TaxID=3117022 RepID=UPI002FEF024D